jgi:hypothetical protein
LSYQGLESDAKVSDVVGFNPLRVVPGANEIVIEWAGCVQELCNEGAEKALGTPERVNARFVLATEEMENDVPGSIGETKT